MKIKPLLPLFVIVVATCLASHRSLAASIQTWAQTYGVDTFFNGKANDDPFYGSGHDFPIAMAKMPDGGFVVGGQIDLPELHMNTGSIGGPASPTGALVRYAADGTILWQTALRQTNDTISNGTLYIASSHIHQVLTDASGNIFVAGGKGNTYNGGEQPFVAKFSPNGHLLWDNGFNAGSAVVGDPPQTVPLGVGTIYYMALTKDGGVVVTLPQSRPNAAYTIPALAKFNANGTLAFTKAYENSIQYLGSTPVCQSKDGSRYVMAFVYATDGSALGSRYGLILLVTDAAGNIIAQRGYNHSDSPGEIPVAIIPTADNGFAVLSGPSPDGYFGILRKLNSDLSTEVFEKHIAIAPGHQFGYFAANSLVETADGGFLLGGASQNQDGSSGTDVMLMKLNSGGALQFVSLLGGPKYEGYPISYSQTTAFAIGTADGGYGFAATSQSYHVGGAISGGAYDIPDWWIGKTDANRKVRGFKDVMIDQPLNTYALTGSPKAGASVSAFSAPGYRYGLATTSQPQFILQDLGAKAPPNRPTVIFQASEPRLVGATRAEAVVGQHFSYQIQAAFFSDFSKVTYNALGLPTNFKIDKKTGVISGVAKAGSETAKPIDLLISATDGTNTADGALHLTITDGVPVLTVNGSDQPTPNVADTVLTFAADYPGTRAGRTVTVEAATNPQGPWTGLNTGLSGYMSYDFTTGKYVLASTNYPQQSAVYFRVHAQTKGYINADVYSNVVGPFNLGSTKARAGRTVFRLKRNGLRADFDFRVTEVSPAAGISLRVQWSKTPEIEGSWTDLPGGGAMKSDGDSNHYALLQETLEPAQGVYFRAIASGAAGQGVIDSVSNFIGSYTIEAEVPPYVSLDSPGGGTPDNPLVIRADPSGVATINIHATATAGAPNRSITGFSLLLHGEPIYTIHPNGTASATIDYVLHKNTDEIGDYTIEALAVDDLGYTARAGTGPRYVRLEPSTQTANAVKAADGTRSIQAATLRHVYTVAKSGGDWDTSSTWRDEKGNQGVPTSVDFVIIGDATVNFDVADVYALSINGGHLVGNPGNLRIRNLLTVYAGSFDSSDAMSVTIDEGAVFELINATEFHIAGIVQNRGTVNLHGPASVVGLSQFFNFGHVNFQLPLIPSATVALGLPPDSRAMSTQLMKDIGKVSVQSLLTENGAGIVTNASANLVTDNGSGLVNYGGGSVISRDGAGVISRDTAGVISNDGNSVVGNDGNSVISNDGNSLITNDGATLISNDGGGLITNDGGSFNVGPGASLSNQKIRAATAETGYIKQGGEIDLTNVRIIGPVTLNGGVLTGSGIIVGNLTNTGGFIAPGHSPGLIAVTGNFSQGANGTSVIEASGAGAGQFDQLQIGGTATLGGKIDLKTTNGYVPSATDPLNPIAAKAVSGSFSSVSPNAHVTGNPTGISATIDPSKPNPSAGQPLNISTRMEVRTGENVLIAGFIVTGPAGSTKKVLIRGLGPSLPVSGSLSDPLLEFHGANGSVVTNDSWKSNQQAEIKATTIPPTNDKEAAIVATIPVGSAGFTNCTAVLKGAHGETGIGLVEVYDLNTTSPAKLANISTRGFVDTGDNVMIGGFIVGGGEPAKMLIRAIGPSLPVAGKLKDTVLELHDQNGMVVTDDDWRGTQEAEVKATAIPPTSEQESAIVATLAPGKYTAVVRGKNNTTGVGLVEAYNLQ